MEGDREMGRERTFFWKRLYYKIQVINPSLKHIVLQSFFVLLKIRPLSSYMDFLKVFLNQICFLCSKFLVASVDLQLFKNYNIKASLLLALQGFALVLLLLN